MTLTPAEGPSRRTALAVATPPPPVIAPPPAVAPPGVTAPPPPAPTSRPPRRSGGGAAVLVMVVVAVGILLSVAASATEQATMTIASTVTLGLGTLGVVVLAVRRMMNPLAAVLVVAVVAAVGAFSLVPTAERVSRCDSTSPGADLTSCNLRGLDLSGEDLSGADLTRATLVNADLSGADLTKADLTKADLRRADLTGADLTHANLRATDFLGAEGLSDRMLADALRVPESDLAAAAIRHDLRFENAKSIVRRVAAVPKGDAVTEAPAYTPSSRFHPIVVLADTKKATASSWLKKARGIWTAPGLRFVELVGAENRTRETIERCQYNIHPITRYRSILTVSVFAAASGRLIDERTFYGSMPRVCGFTESSALYSITGTPADFEGEVIPWLKGIVNPLPGK